MPSEVMSNYKVGDAVVFIKTIRNKNGSLIHGGQLARVTSIDENDDWIEIYISSNCWVIRGYARVTADDIKLFQKG